MSGPTFNYKSPQGILYYPGRTQRASYCIPIPNAAPASANYVVCAINSGPNAYTKIRRVILWNPGQFTAAQKVIIDAVRLNALSTGGVAYVPNLYDTKYDPAYSGQVLITSPAVTPVGQSMTLLSAYAPTAVGNYVPFVLDFTTEMGLKPIVIPPSNSLEGQNGLAFRVTNGAAGGANFDITIEISEEEW